MKMQLPYCEVHSKVDEYESEEQELEKQTKCMAVLRNDHTRRSLNLFNECFAIFLNCSISWLILSLHNWPTMPTNTNMYMLVQRLLRYIHVHAEWAQARHTVRIRTPCD